MMDILIAFEKNANIKVIKYIHKLFPSCIHSQANLNGFIFNAACLVLENGRLKRSGNQIKMTQKILHYLNGIDIHLLEMNEIPNHSIYSLSKNYSLGKDMEK